jgi:heat-inducible transcriptional repressor
MFLDDRKRRILQAIIDDYIDTAEPVGSRTIARRHELGLSSATIRNEMADLEEMGFLSQPHTSAGRIPSDKGYRLYVDQLMRTRDLTPEEIKSIKAAMEIKISELSQLIRQASVVMSRFTRYTSMAITPQMRRSTLKAVQVVPIEPGKVLVIVVTNAGVVRNNLVRISDNATPDFLIRISDTLNGKLSGLTIGEITPQVINDIENEIGISTNLLMPILNGVADCIHQIDNPEIYLDGTTNILNFPEFRDISRAKDFLTVLDEKDILCKLLNCPSESGDVKVRIGSENSVNEIKDCSLVTTSYSFGNRVIGTIGVIGPTRMDYSRVISSLNFIKRKVGEEIQKLLGEYVDEE